MVGLRWWDDIKEDGSNLWVFESLEDRSNIHGGEKMIFWVALFVSPLLWLILGISVFFSLKLQWFLIVLIALVLGSANLVGYVKCAKDAKAKVKKMATSYLSTALWSSVASQSQGNQV